ncbi:MAG: hypothetical protein ABIN36_09690 [Ferruginibacter sp.]
MNNYLQKIASRVAGDLPASRDNAGQLLPIQQPGFYNPQDDLVEDFNQQQAEQLLPPDNDSERLSRNQDSTIQNTVLPAPDTKPMYPQNNQDRNQESFSQIPGTTALNRPSIERITERNIRSLPVKDELTAVRTIEQHTTSEVTNKGKNTFPAVLPQQIHPTKSEAAVTKQDIDKARAFKADTSKKGERENLGPAKTEALPFNFPNKKVEPNKLVIGRITVEVINPPKPPAKNMELPTRQKAPATAVSNQLTGINKRSFGLGQL